MSCGLTEGPHVERLAAAVGPLLVAAPAYEPEPDPLRICMLACLDFQMRGAAVEKSLNHFYERAAGKLAIEDLSSLRMYLEGTSSDEEAAVALWGARYWTRAALLRQLVGFFLRIRSGHEPEIEAMRRWARDAQFKRDFQGTVKGLGYNTFVRMAQRLGANTAAPTGWTCHYVAETVGKEPTDQCLVEVLNAAADRLSHPRADVDWAIRRHQGHP